MSLIPLCLHLGLTAGEASLLLLRTAVITLCLPGQSSMLSHPKLYNLNYVCKVPFAL